MKQTISLEADIKLFQFQRNLPVCEVTEAAVIIENFLMCPEELARLRIEYVLRTWDAERMQ